MIVLTALVIVMSTLSYNPFYRLYRENGAATLQEYHLEKLYNKLLFCTEVTAQFHLFCFTFE